MSTKKIKQIQGQENRKKVHRHLMINYVHKMQYGYNDVFQLQKKL